MITQLEVLTPRVTLSPIPFADGSPATDPIQIRNIDGLGPVIATINTTQFGTLDNEFFNNSYIGKRNIVITVGLNPNWADLTFESLRQILYAYFMPKNQVTLKFTSTHLVPVQIDGIVESAVPNMFSQDPEFQISIICAKHAFVASELTVVPGLTLALPDGTPTVINYRGTLPTGFILDVSATTTAPTMTAGEVRLINENPLKGIFIVTATIDATHLLETCTIQGSKYVRSVLLPTSVPTSILGQQSVGSAWLQLDEGINKFRVMSALPGQAWTMKYYELYGGI